MAVLADAIRTAMQRHLDSGNVVLGQNVSEGLGDTIPTPHDNLLTLPTSDSSNAGVAVGFALAGRRPVFVVRFQPLLKFALPALEYAAKSKALWGIPCPIFIRAAALEGGIGPVCSGAVHGLGMRCPGLKVVAPMTSEEWSRCWQEFLDGDDPVLCSEQRSSWGNQPEDNMPPLTYPNGAAAVSVFAIGSARHSLLEASRKYPMNAYGIWRLKPLGPLPPLPRKVLVVDCEPAICGTAEHVAMEVHRRTGARVEVLGLEDRVAGFSPESDVLTSSADAIIEAVKRLEET